MPPPTPETAPKYIRVAQTLENQILNGKWEQGRMPSVRGIATIHKVSVVTASRALQVLRDKGLIQTIERSGCYRMPAPDAIRWAVVLHLTPGPWQRANISISRTGFEDLARKRPMQLDFDAFHISSGLTVAEARRAAETARENQVQGVFLLPSRANDRDTEAESVFLEGCVAAELPVVLLERNLRQRQTLAHDLAGMDDLQAASQCVKHLQDIGRKRIGIIIASPTSTHNDRVAGYLYAQHAFRSTQHRGSQEIKDVVIRQPSELPTKEAYAAVADAVIRERFDGVLCYSDYTALGLIMELLNRGMRVPRDVAIVGFDNLPIGDQFAIGITTYDYPAESMAEQAVRLMEDRIKNPDRDPVRVSVNGKLIIRGSTIETSASYQA